VNKWELEYSLKISHGREWERSHGNGKEWVHESHSRSRTSLIQCNAATDAQRSAAIAVGLLTIGQRVTHHQIWMSHDSRVTACDLLTRHLQTFVNAFSAFMVVGQSVGQ